MNWRDSLAATGLLLSTACSSSPSTTPSDGPIATVTITPDTRILVQGDQLQLNASLKDADGHTLTGHSVTWTTSTPAVATVNAGLISAVSPGTSTITATSEGKSGQAVFTVAQPTDPVASVSITIGAGNLVVGGTIQLTATTKNAVGTVLQNRSVVWNSVNPTVASVSQDGLVTGLQAGAVTIIATSENIGGIASLTVKP